MRINYPSSLNYVYQSVSILEFLVSYNLQVISILVSNIQVILVILIYDFTTLLFLSLFTRPAKVICSLKLYYLVKIIIIK